MHIVTGLLAPIRLYLPQKQEVLALLRRSQALDIVDIHDEWSDSDAVPSINH